MAEKVTKIEIPISGTKRQIVTHWGGSGIVTCLPIVESHLLDLTGNQSILSYITIVEQLVSTPVMLQCARLCVHYNGLLLLRSEISCVFKKKMSQSLNIDLFTLHKMVLFLFIYLYVLMTTVLQ